MKTFKFAPSRLAEAMKLHQQNQFETAKELYLQLLQLDPKNVDVLHLLGIVFKDLKQYEISINYFKQAASLNPRIPQLYHNLGLAYKELGEVELAVETYQKAIKLAPNYHAAYHKLANAYSLLEKNELAFENFQKALAIKPDDVDVWLDFGGFFKKIKKLSMAQTSYETALKYQANCAAAYFELANIFKDDKQLEKSLQYYKKALALKADYPEAFANMSILQDDICDWRDFENRRKKLREIHAACLKSNKPSHIAALTALILNWQPKELLELNQHNAKCLMTQLQPLQKTLHFWHDPATKKDRIKIGYISYDFRNHPAAHLTLNLYANHDRKDFEVYIFSHGPDDKSVYRKHIEKTCDHFIDVANETELEIAKIIYNHHIDILVDLTGYTYGDKTKTLALRPAPIQINYLGFLGTTGANYIDYTFVDDTVITPENAPFYSEKLVYLPKCYQINDDQHPIAEKPLTRSDYQLPEKAFVFCCFNSSYKIEPQVFSIWMKILASTPNSILWLVSPSQLVITNLRNEAEKCGVNPERLIFTNYEEKSLYLARYRLADLFLDTFVYNANTTGNDALWAGLPLLTFPGAHLANRTAASLLKTLELSELIATNPEDYQAKAIYFYNHPDELKKIRDKLWENRPALFNTKHFVKNLEKAYRTMWEIYSSGNPPQAIHIKENT